MSQTHADPQTSRERVQIENAAATKRWTPGTRANYRHYADEPPHGCTVVKSYHHSAGITVAIVLDEPLFGKREINVCAARLTKYRKIGGRE